MFVCLPFRNMPEVDVLMQEWPAEFEDTLREVNTLFCCSAVSGPLAGNEMGGAFVKSGPFPHQMKRN